MNFFHLPASSLKSKCFICDRKPGMVVGNKLNEKGACNLCAYDALVHMTCRITGHQMHEGALHQSRYCDDDSSSCCCPIPCCYQKTLSADLVHERHLAINTGLSIVSTEWTWQSMPRRPLPSLFDNYADESSSKTPLFKADTATNGHARHYLQSS